MYVYIYIYVFISYLKMISLHPRLLAPRLGLVKGRRGASVFQACVVKMLGFNLGFNQQNWELARQNLDETMGG
jgi:hypothetical protein